MSHMTWRDAAEAMIHGAAMTPPTTHTAFKWVDGVMHTCALGATFVGFVGVEVVSAAEHDFVPKYIGSINDLDARYYNRYGRPYTLDNDVYGRDYVVANVKELLNDV